MSLSLQVHKKLDKFNFVLKMELSSRGSKFVQLIFRDPMNETIMAAHSKAVETL